MPKIDYLDTLPLTEAEKEKIRTLALKGPEDLYNLIGSSMVTDHSFENYFGKERTYHLIRFLFPLLPKKNK